MHKATCILHSAFCIALISSACASVPVAPAVPVVTWEQKLGWMVRLEDQRILRDANPSPPVVLRPATTREPAIVAPLPPSDLIRLLNDNEARVRRRAALAIGRVGLADGVDPLVRLLGDGEIEVRQMAAFALGLIGDRSARPPLVNALKDAQPLLQGRAAEALGLIGDRSDADAIGAMIQVHIRAGALKAVAPDEVTYPLDASIEAVRLGLYALARLTAYEPLAAAVLDGSGQPVSTWWPVAYALQRVGDARAAPALTALINTPGRFTASFAVKGVGSTKAIQAAPALRQIVEQRQQPPAVVIQAVRSLAALRDAAAVPLLTKIVADTRADPTLRLEAMTAFGALVSADALDGLLDLVSNPVPAIRGTALQSLARVDPQTFLSTLAVLDTDREWTVRAAIANALGTLPADQSLPRLTVMLQERDQKVVAAVIGALAASKASGIERILIDRLTAEDVVVRSAAANAIADLKIAAGVQALSDAYRSAAGESTYVARGAALGALARLDPAAARPVLNEALKDRDWAVRVRAAALLLEQGVTDADPIRPAAPGRAVEDPQWQALVLPSFSPHVFLDTDKGTIEIELAVVDAPLTAGNFIALARKGFFNGVAIHRLVPDFVVQDGDPRGDGEGGPGYTIRDEINQRPHLRGIVGMALDWEDTGGSQFFITHSPQPHLDARYTVFGHVVAGMDVVDRLVQWDVVKRVRIRDGVAPE
ncbi:MAG TPA: HEAT repeat domain-containing protein [Vicinamibacterales bacterium]|nr:HEAT repeat domain-containing protein [Vicinamibacterales bacterium]